MPQPQQRLGISGIGTAVMRFKRRWWWTQRAPRANMSGAVWGAAVGLVRRRSAFTFKTPDGMDVTSWPAVVGVDEGWYWKPDAGRLLGSPANADDTVPHDVMPEEIDIAIGIDRPNHRDDVDHPPPETNVGRLRLFVSDGELGDRFDNHARASSWLATQNWLWYPECSWRGELAAAALICSETRRISTSSREG